jgi:hypothetical protein
MAQKHKSKYKAPKDLEKSRKLTTRKDLKDYTHDDKQGGLNPKSTGDKQLNVLRKTDKAVQDDGKLFPKYNDDDRLYKDIEDGDYDPKVAAKRLKKRQDTEEKETKDVLKDKIENLTREQKERLVREYVRRKIAIYILEQAAPAATPPAEEEETPPTDAAAATPPADAAAATPPADASATPPADTSATPPAGGAAPAAPAATTATPAATTPATTPAASATGDSAEKEESPEEAEDKAVRLTVDKLSKEGLHGKIKFLARIFKSTTKDLDEPEDEKNFYIALRQYAIRKLSTIGKSDGESKKSSEESDSESETETQS